MSRRDIIIAAVLVNTGLLAILFMMALHSDKPLDVESKEINEAVVVQSQPQEILIEASASPQPRDELDQMLKDYPLTAAVSPPIVLEETSPAARVKTPNPNNERNTVEVTVKRGDYLEKIAKANGTTIEAIMKANKLSSERLDIGQVLKIPLTQKVAEITATKKNIPQTNATNSNTQYYTLKSGDNPWKVAKEFHVKFDDLLKLNSLDEEKAKGLKPGDVLRVH